MRKNAYHLLTVLLIAVLLLAGCTTTKEAATSIEFQNPAEAQALIEGSWIEVNREGNVETHTWGADGSFTAEITTPDGDLVERCVGNYFFEDGKLVINVTQDAGDYNNYQLEDIELTNWYNYYVTKSTLHLERVQRSIFGNVETFDPPLLDDYTRAAAAPAAPVTPAKPAQAPEEAAPLIIGTWTEINRDGNVETNSWGEDFSFQAVTVDPDGNTVEVDSGFYEFVDGQIKLTITNVGGDWNGGVLEPFDPPIEGFYNYYVTKNSLHLERTKRIMFGNEETFNPPLSDDYTRK